MIETTMPAPNPIYKQLFWIEPWFQQPVEVFEFTQEQIHE